MRRATFAAILALALGASAEAGSKLKRPSFFIEPGYQSSLLEGIDRRTRDKIAFDRHFSLTFVPCGTGCGSFWFVDRRTGGVIEAPPSSVTGEDIWDVRARPHSNVISIVYGPRFSDGPERCFARHFRRSGNKFVPLDRRKSAQCPG